MGTSGMKLGKYETMPVELRLMKFIEVTPNCWNWVGALTDRGYAQIGPGGGSTKKESAHRLIYSLSKGEIPDGTEVDHLCFNTACVNPDHLEAVPHEINVTRAVIHYGHFNCKRKGCEHGHAI